MSTITRLEFKNGAKKENKYIKNGAKYEIYMAVRTPAQLRAVLAADHLDEGQAAVIKTGLFNDGIMASESDLGTSGVSPISQQSMAGESFYSSISFWH